METDEQIQLHVQRLRNCSSKVARKAINKLAEIGAPAVPALKEEARNEATFVRTRAMVALELINRTAKAAVTALKEAVTDKKPS